MSKLHGWPVEPIVALPEGYQLREDTTGAYLYHKGGAIRVFTHNASPYKIAMEARAHAKEEGE